MASVDEKEQGQKADVDKTAQQILNDQLQGDDSHELIPREKASDIVHSALGPNGLHSDYGPILPRG